MYYQLELRPFAKSRTPEAVPIFLIRKSPETQTMLVLNSGGKDTAKTGTYQTNSPAVISRVIKLFRGLFLGLISACFSHFSTVL